MCWALEGAFTGEISPLMLLECGVRWVVLGHSERRALFGELDERVNEKVRCGAGARDHADRRRRRNRRASTLPEPHAIRSCAQTRAAFDGIAADDVARCVVAYEPIWAIGTGTAESRPKRNP